MFIRILSTTLPQMFCQIMLHSRVIFKSMIIPDDNLQRALRREHHEGWGLRCKNWAALTSILCWRRWQRVHWRRLFVKDRIDRTLGMLDTAAAAASCNIYFLRTTNEFICRRVSDDRVEAGVLSGLRYCRSTVANLVGQSGLCLSRFWLLSSFCLCRTGVGLTPGQSQHSWSVFAHGQDLIWWVLLHSIRDSAISCKNSSF